MHNVVEGNNKIPKTKETVKRQSTNLSLKNRQICLHVTNNQTCRNYSNDPELVQAFQKKWLV